MSRTGWHTLREPGGVTVARALPPRFDVAAEARLPAARPGRLAHQIRQDLWRACRAVRGFSPVVRVEPAGEGVLVRAGGRLAAPAPPTLGARIAALLDDPANRRRWLANAAPRKGGAQPC